MLPSRHTASWPVEARSHPAPSSCWRAGRPPVALAVAALALAAGAAPAASQGRTHTYYVAADEVEWDYAPSGRDRITGALFDTTTAMVAPQQAMYFNVRKERGRIGHVYKKALYREYTDSSFAVLKPRPPEWEHLGFLGPLLRAVVGDTILVVFRNNASRPYSMHPHGVFYDKDSEGTPYQDGTSGSDKADDAVPPGGTHVYTWPVPERAGPGPHDPSSIMWMYHSHVNEGKDINAGLMGPMIVTAREMARADGTPVDVDREFLVQFSDGEETDSWYIGDNVRAYVPDMEPDSVTSQPGFFVHNVSPSMNGWLYGNMPVLTMEQGERVRWYVMAGTNDFDFHTPHWHGNTVLMHGHRMDIISVEPMMMAHVDMVADNPGIWFFHCHVKAHLGAGMAARFAVLPQERLARAELERALAADAEGATATVRFGAAAAGIATQAPGWLARLDQPEADPSAVRLVSAGGALEATMGPAAIFFDPTTSATGEYRAGATFFQTRLTDQPEAYGLLVGGRNLDHHDQDYLYFLVRQDGSYLVKHRAGHETHTLIDWTPHEAVRRPDASGAAANALAVEALAEGVRFLVNGVEVTRLERVPYLNTDGLVGLRVNHNLAVRIEDFSVERLAGR